MILRNKSLMRTTLGKDLAPWNSCSSIVNACDRCCRGHWFDFCFGLRISFSCHSACCCATDRWHYVIVWLELEANKHTTNRIDDWPTNDWKLLWYIVAICRTYPKWNCLHKLKLILWSYLIYVVRMVTCCIRSCFSVIFQVRVVLTRTVVVVDWRFNILKGGHPTWL